MINKRSGYWEQKGHRKKQSFCLNGCGEGLTEERSPGQMQRTF